MSTRMWVVGAIAAVTPGLAHAQDGSFDTPQRLDGIVVSVGFEPAAMAPGWADSHRSSGTDTAAPAVRAELDRHLVVAVVDELTRARVGDARIEVTLTRTGTPGSAFTGKLELMKRGSPPSYGTMLTIDPLAEYTLELTIRRPNQAEPIRARFGPARIPMSGSAGDLRKQPATDPK